MYNLGSQPTKKIYAKNILKFKRCGKYFFIAFLMLKKPGFLFFDKSFTINLMLLSSFAEVIPFLQLECNKLTVV